MKYYTGIGSRETPTNIKSKMIEIGCYLSKQGWVLRSGKAEGADYAFQIGAQSYMMNPGCEIYIPWKGFTTPGLYNTWDIHDWPEQECYDIASIIHPAWDKCSQGAKRLHARNVCQVLGKNLDTPSKFVVYWAKEDSNGEPKGGTRTAVMLARRHNIPTVNMLHDSWKVKMREVLNEKE